MQNRFKIQNWKGGLRPQ